MLEFGRVQWGMEVRVRVQAWGQSKDFIEAIGNAPSYMPVSSICRRKIMHAQLSSITKSNLSWARDECWRLRVRCWV